MRSRPAAALLILAASLSSLPALAQTANSSPTAPAPGGGAATPSSTAGPSGGAPGAAAPKPALGDETPTERDAQRKSDKDMTICKGC